ncbi:MAG: RNA polymerase factor sigma-54, partial [Pirellulaceae bacterium]|nr:RNA polymerase factor sigma-54 [Pirellulaceae bacterium]
QLGINQRMIQKQIMAPRMIPAMEILQLPMMALEERIEQELNENPVLEQQEQDPNLPDESTAEETTETTDEGEREMVVDDNNTEDFERLLNLDQDVPDYFDEQPRRSANRMDEEADRKHDTIANIAARPQSLNDYLLDQLSELELSDDVRRLAIRIVSTLAAEDGGYFRASLDDLSPPDAAPEMREHAQRALEAVQSLDPSGVAARDLRECLLLQLDPDDPYYEELKTLISGHLEDLSDNRLPQIQRITGYSIELIQEAWEALRKLNPKPGARWADVHVPKVTPDVFVERDENGTYKVRLEDGRTPSLYISNYYRRRLANGTATTEEREFIKRKINSAQWFIESIEQRRSTLTRVSQAIVDHQKEFLDHGPEFIVPLKMQQIADRVGVHVTTVSRAVDDKWIQTARGIIPLKRFFVGGTQDASGEDVAWDKIRLKLQQVIDEEDKSKPYSDDDLVSQLEKKGLKVARRTITKYRKKMGIPSSRQRRVWTEK